jgi:hypothetical protein
MVFPETLRFYFRQTLKREVKPAQYQQNYLFQRKQKNGKNKKKAISQDGIQTGQKESE